jgi:hypothetical protein
MSGRQPPIPRVPIWQRYMQYPYIGVIAPNVPFLLVAAVPGVMRSDDQDDGRSASSRNAPGPTSACQSKHEGPAAVCWRFMKGPRDADLPSCSIGEPAFPLPTSRCPSRGAQRRRLEGGEPPAASTAEHSADRGSRVELIDKRGVTALVSQLPCVRRVEHACPGISPAAVAPKSILCASARRHVFTRRCSAGEQVGMRFLQPLEQFVRRE